MNDTRHVTHLITDFVLDLLSEEERRKVFSHIATCQKCQLVLQQERQVGFSVLSTLSAVTKIEPNRLRQLRPLMPGIREGIFSNFGWQQQMVLATFLLLIIVGAFGIQSQIRQEAWLSTSPAVHSTMAAVTDTPTLTLSATRRCGAVKYYRANA